jgi:ABC-type Na+ efflux pump permease subunit
VYGIIALWGGLGGLLIAQKWGGWSSVMGKAIILLSCGLLAQEFGQLVFSYYNIYAHIEVPYPSLADVGFMGSIFFYAAGMIMLGKAAGITYSLNKVSGKLQIILIPLAMLVVSYSLFLTNYEFDWSSPLTIFLYFLRYFHLYTFK